MAISSVSLNPNAIGAVAAQTQNSDAAQKGTQSALARDDANTSARTQFSDFGRTKLSLENVKDAAETARNINNPPALSEFKNAVQGVVKSLNALNETVRAAETATDQRPLQALNEVRNALAASNEDGADTLQKLGISTQQDGTFAINQRQLERSFKEDSQGAQSALRDVSNRVEQAVDRQLSGTPPAVQTKTTEAPPEGSNANDAQIEDRARAEQRESFRQLLASQLANAGSNTARNAVTTYFSVATL